MVGMPTESDRSRKLTEAQNAKIRKLNDERRVSGKDEFSEQEIVDVFNPKLSDADLWGMQVR